MAPSGKRPEMGGGTLDSCTQKQRNWRREKESSGKSREGGGGKREAWGMQREAGDEA